MTDNYIIKIQRMIDAGKLPVDANNLNLLEILHDEWCSSHVGDPCNCNPDIILNGIEIKEMETNH